MSKVRTLEEQKKLYESWQQSGLSKTNAASHGEPKAKASSPRSEVSTQNLTYIAA